MSWTGSYRGLVDTGATSTFILKDLARKLNLEFAAKDTVRAVNRGPVVTKSYTLGVRLHGFPDIFIEAFEFTDFPVDIIVGMDIIMRSTLTVDGRKECFTMRPLPLL